MTKKDPFPAQADLFAAVRAIPAHEAAGRLGLSLARRGERCWACCPIHGERTASLCFYPDGRYYCFGCHASGTTVDLYMAVTGQDALAAARQAAADFHLTVDASAPRAPRPIRPKREALREARRSRLCQMRAMREAADKKLQAYTGEDAWDDPEFLLALQMRAQADELSGMIDSTDDAAALPLEHTTHETDDDVGGYEQHAAYGICQPL